MCRRGPAPAFSPGSLAVGAGPGLSCSMRWSRQSLEWAPYMLHSIGVLGGKARSEINVGGTVAELNMCRRGSEPSFYPGSSAVEARPGRSCSMRRTRHRLQPASQMLHSVGLSGGITRSEINVGGIVAELTMCRRGPAPAFSRGSMAVGAGPGRSCSMRLARNSLEGALYVLHSVDF